ncbi:MAG: IS5 family transposase [Gaiellaceae bacterium]
MRGEDRSNGQLFSYVSIEDRIHEKHPLRLIREVVNEALASMSREFDAVYADDGRPSIPPERLLRALLLQAFYSIRSERLLMEQMEFNTLYRWFVGLDPDAPVWDASVFAKNRDRLLEAAIASKFLAAIIAHPRVRRLLSKDHFTVDGTMIDAFASMKSFRRKDGGDDDPDAPGGNGTRNFRAERRSNETHESTTDKDARLFRKGNGKESRLCYLGHALMENRNGLVVEAELTRATGTAECEAALAMIDRHRPFTPGKAHRRITLGGDKGFDRWGFVSALKERKVTPHIAVQGHLSKTGKPRKTAVDARTQRHSGYRVSQIVRKRVEEIFGWTKYAAGQAQTKFRGLKRVAASFIFTVTAYNLIRLPKLLANG